MNLEELTKSQIVLLTLLVSFVTSIATGIVTVSLIDQAPQSVTETVSHIIRETVQNAVPNVIAQSAGVAQVKKEESPPPPPEPDLPQAVQAAEHSVVRLYSDSSPNAYFLGLGVVLSADGTIVTDSDAIGRLQSAIAVLVSGSSTPLSVVSEEAESGFAYLSPTSTSSARLLVPGKVSADQLSIGESIVQLTGKSSFRIASGLIVGLADSASPKVLLTDFPAFSVIKGTPLINTRGEFVAMSTGEARRIESTAFIPIVSLKPQGQTPNSP